MRQILNIITQKANIAWGIDLLVPLSLHPWPSRFEPQHLFCLSTFLIQINEELLHIPTCRVFFVCLKQREFSSQYFHYVAAALFASHYTHPKPKKCSLFATTKLLLVLLFDKKFALILMMHRKALHRAFFLSHNGRIIYLESFEYLPRYLHEIGRQRGKNKRKEEWKLRKHVMHVGVEKRKLLAWKKA